MEGLDDVRRPVAGATPGVVALPSPRPAAGKISLAYVAAAQVVVADLLDRFGFELWMVTAVRAGQQWVVASRGRWGSVLPAGRMQAFSLSFCQRMVEYDGPIAVCDVARVERYAAAAVGPFAPVRAYLGVPVVAAGGDLVGTLCGLSDRPQPTAMPAALGQVQVMGRLLGAIAAAEQVAAGRAQLAARALELAELDPLTGLRNRRGWNAAMAREETRTQRYGGSLSVLVVDLDGLKTLNDQYGHATGDQALAACGRVLTAGCRPSDTIARIGGDEFAVLAVQCDQRCARTLAERLRRRLAAAGVRASVGVATGRPDEQLHDTWRRADALMYRQKLRRRTERPDRAAGTGGP